MDIFHILRINKAIFEKTALFLLLLAKPYLFASLKCCFTP